MNPLFLQSMVVSGPQPTSQAPAYLALLIAIPLIMILTGMVLGFHALKDIRLAGGRLGGAMLATFAAGLLPCAFILVLCGGGMALLAEEISPAARRREDLFAALGVMGGLWMCFVMMRGMYRQATGWVAPAEAARRAPLTGTATAALIFTILGGLLIFTCISRPDFMVILGPFTARDMVLVNLAVITAGLVCGVVARAEKTGKVCAWICGALFIFLVLAHS